MKKFKFPNLVFVNFEFQIPTSKLCLLGKLSEKEKKKSIEFSVLKFSTLTKRKHCIFLSLKNSWAISFTTLAQCFLSCDNHQARETVLSCLPRKLSLITDIQQSHTTVTYDWYTIVTYIYHSEVLTFAGNAWRRPKKICISLLDRKYINLMEI